jgi:iron(III) transport system permease protein
MLFAAAGFGVALTAIPLIYLLVRTFDSGLEDVLAVVIRARTFEFLSNSLFLVVSVSFAAVAIGTFQAWLTMRSALRFRSLFAILAMLPLAVPSYVAAFSWIAIVPGFSGFFPAWLILSLGTAPYVYLAVTASLMRSDGAAEEVARSLGLNVLQTFAQVTWPMIRPAALSGGLIAALYALSDFGAVSLVRYDTFTRAIFNAYRSSFDRNLAASLATILVVVTAIILVIQQRIGREVLSTSARPRFAHPTHLRHSYVYELMLLAIAGLGIGVPTVSLLRWMNVGLSSADTGEIFRATINTLGFASAGASFVTLFAIVIALVISRYSTPSTRRLESTMWLTHSLPGIVVALSMVFFSNRYLPAIYQTSILVVITYIILFVPNAVAVIKTPLQQISHSVVEVSRTLGYSNSKVIGRVLLPIVRPAIASGAALVALTIIKELPATLLLRPTGIETLATRLWGATSINAFGQAAPYAVLLIVLAGIPALALNSQVRKTYRRQSGSEDSQNINVVKESV